jgi:hypothetical protein
MPTMTPIGQTRSAQSAARCKIKAPPHPAQARAAGFVLLIMIRRCLADALAKVQLYRCSGFSLMRLQIVQQIQHLGR